LTTSGDFADVTKEGSAVWRKPGYEGGQATPQVEQRGQLITAIPRGKPDRDTGQHGEEFRVTLDEFQGHPYIALRLFVRGNDGETMFPSKKGVSVRLGEAERVAAAILEALRLSEEPGGGQAPASGRERQAADDGP
jgi:Transcriptional Coactivator p15 (PC4)